MKKTIFKSIIIFLCLQGILMAATIKHLDIKGLKVPVVFEQDKNLPILNLQLVFTNSGYIQDGDKNGIASTSSKLLNEGTKKLGSTKFAEKLENSAISIDANTGIKKKTKKKQQITKKKKPRKINP